MGASASNISMRRKGAFLQVSDEEGQVKRIIREDDGSVSHMKCKKIFLKLGDITSVSQKLEENDVIITLKNGVEYVLDNLESPDETFEGLRKKIFCAEDDE